MPQHCQLDSCRLRYFAGRLDADGHLVRNTWTPTPKQGDKLRPGTPAAAAALPREDAGQRLLSQPQSRGCNPLHAIRDVLHVSSFLASSVDAALLLGHWLSHYIYGLGVVPSHDEAVLASLDQLEGPARRRKACGVRRAVAIRIWSLGLEARR